ncbi:glutathione S-transferase family protein [Candidatus Reidiella endopervernicosa]|nr:glutathione S-transferase family protein [Candidatus Reidiella endopervernicosa]QKQ25915.1 glutathione S-transferase family protein [Candidatus Reidiella endopervernicosa]
MKLYNFEISGNCYKIRLLLSLLGIEHELVPVDLRQGENFEPALLKLNPRAQIPVLDDDGTIIWDSSAILTYLARQYGGERWLPTDPLGMAEVVQWLAVSENEILYGLARARAIKLMNKPWNPEECRKLGEQALEVVEQQLAKSSWLAGHTITIADIACYPYIGLSGDGGFSLDPYPAIRQWMARIETQPGYITMPGLMRVGEG